MIDRSKPLSIHEFQSLIDEVARLKELAGRRQAILVRQQDTRTPNYALIERLDIERDLLNAAPALLDVLDEIRAGDADILDGMATWFACSDDPDQFSRQIEILRRYRDMVKKMEAKSE